VSVPASVIAARFMRLAQEHPQDAADIFERAAKTFANFAMDPRYAGRRGEYELFSREFAKAIPEPPPSATVDDFEQLLASSSEAFNDTNAPSTSISRDIQEIGDTRTQESGDLTSRAPRVSVIPATVDSKTVLGRVGVFKYAPSADDMQQQILQSDTVAFWQGKKWESQAVTIDIANFTIPPNPPTAQVSARPYGIVTFGADGCFGQVKFDINYGARFTLVGNYVSVLVGMDPPRRGYMSASRRLGASLGFFAAPSTAPVTLTEYIDGLVAFGTTFLTRPNRATAILPIQTSNPDTGILGLNFIEEGGGLITRLTIVGATQLTPIPLTPDVAIIEVINNGPEQVSVRLPFQLAL